MSVWRNSGEISCAAVAFCRILSTPLATGPGADATIAATSAGDACSRSPDSNQLIVLDPPTLVICIWVLGPHAPLAGETNLPSGSVKPGTPLAVAGTIDGEGTVETGPSAEIAGAAAVDVAVAVDVEVAAAAAAIDVKAAAGEAGATRNEDVVRVPGPGSEASAAIADAGLDGRFVVGSRPVDREVPLLRTAPSLKSGADRRTCAG